MTQQATNDTKIALSGHRLSKDWTVAHIPGTDFEVIIERFQRFDETDSPYRVSVEEELVEARSEGLRHLAKAESELGEGRRWAGRGIHPDVDELYDQINAEVAAVKEAITREAITAIAGLLDDSEIWVQVALDGARHDAYAGCTMCPCSPGVTLAKKLSRGGHTVVFNIRQHRPAPKHHLSKTQVDALIAAKYEQLIRWEEHNKPLHVYSTRGGETFTFRPATIDKLFTLDLIRTGDRKGTQRTLLLTADGEFELFARS